MRRLWFFVHKEWLLLSRDIHGLLLLFVMPTVFILIMSMALQNQFANQGAVTLDYYLVNHDNETYSNSLVDELAKDSNFNKLSSDNETETQLRHKVEQDEVKFLLVIPSDFQQRLADGKVVLELDVAPGTESAMKLLFEARLKGLLSVIVSQKTLASSQRAKPKAEPVIQVSHLYKGKDGELVPTSVQQNVPAYLLFAMFFIAIPLSTTLIGERQQGTLARLQTMAFPHYLLFIGKMIPYFFITLIQVVLMLLVGMFLVPLLGGEQLVLGNSTAGLIIMSISASLAAVAYALFVAQIVSTTEQATIFVGVSNIIMAALGGIMVPRFVMPPVMQDISLFSPMAWGLEGFLDILLRSGEVQDILPEAGGLLALAVILLLLSVVISKKKQGS